MLGNNSYFLGVQSKILKAVKSTFYWAKNEDFTIIGTDAYKAYIIPNQFVVIDCNIFKPESESFRKLLKVDCDYQQGIYMETNEKGDVKLRANESDDFDIYADSKLMGEFIKNDDFSFRVSSPVSPIYVYYNDAPCALICPKKVY